jgi:hypothetical protein
MAFDYSRFVNLASDQLQDKGRKVNLIQKTVARDIVLDTFTETTVSTSVFAVFTQLKTGQMESDEIKMGDDMCLIASKDLAAGIVPTTDDRILDGVRTLEIASVKEIKTGGSSILYKCVVRS